MFKCVFSIAQFVQFILAELSGRNWIILLFQITTPKIRFPIGVSCAIYNLFLLLFFFFCVLNQHDIDFLLGDNGRFLLQSAHLYNYAHGFHVLENANISFFFTLLNFNMHRYLLVKGRWPQLMALCSCLWCHVKIYQNTWHFHLSDTPCILRDLYSLQFSLSVPSWYIHQGECIFCLFKKQVIKSRKFCNKNRLIQFKESKSP